MARCHSEIVLIVGTPKLRPAQVLRASQDFTGVINNTDTIL